MRRDTKLHVELQKVLGRTGLPWQNTTIINDLYSKLGTLICKLEIMDMPDRFWNCDETGLCYVVKPNCVV
jgi:hypothetical protein